MTTKALVVVHRNRQHRRLSKRHWFETPPMERLTCSIGGLALWPTVIQCSRMVRNVDGFECPCFGPLANFRS